MTKPRLFVFGDSFAFNYFSNKENLINVAPHFGNGAVKAYVEYYNYFGHWIDHLQNFYDVYSFGQGAASNEQIIFQLGSLHDFEYTPGDRVIVIFSTPERLTVVLRKIKYNLAPSGLLYKSLFSNPDIISFIENQYLERSKRWEDTSILKEEKKFITFLKTLLEKWNPIFFTWTPTLNIESVELIPFPPFDFSIYKESSGYCDDWHLGVEGNYKLFKVFAEILNIDIPQYSFSFQPFSPKLL